jgi:type VII secretion-associated protein (TIGR03931 family)
MVRTAMSTTAVCELGPVAVGRWSANPGLPMRTAPAAEATAVLDCGDDPLVLLGGRAVVSDELWRAVLGPLLGGADEAVLVHPSWWPPNRIEMVASVACGLAAGVDAQPRSRLLAAVARDAPVVEIGPRLVVVTAGAGAPLAVQTRAVAPGSVADSVVRELLRQTGPGPVWLDGPAGVPGAHALSVLIGERLRSAGRAVSRVGAHQLAVAAADLMKSEDVLDDSRRRRQRRPLVAASGAGLAVTLAAVVIGGTQRDGPAPSPATALVEGRVTMQIPAHWVVQRITSGPGSARVQVVSPIDGQLALHLTQSPVRDDSLDAAAAILRTAIDAQPAGVFVDFHPSDVRGGRPVITYREVRPWHDIRWTVLLDGDVRISIGCQSAAGSEQRISEPCEQAVRSAHEIR